MADVCVASGQLLSATRLACAHQVSVPVPGLAGAAGRALLEADTDPAAAAGPPAGAHSSLTLPPLRRRLGLVLYSTPTAAALQGVQQPVSRMLLTHCAYL